MALHAILRAGFRPESGGLVIATTDDAAVLHLLKTLALAEARERTEEAAELGERTVALLEAEREKMLRRVLDELLPEAPGQAVPAPSVPV